MKAKKILIPTIITLAVAVPVITAIAIAAKPIDASAATTYAMSYNVTSNSNFNPEELKRFQLNQKYINFLKSQTKEVFDAYKKINSSFDALNLDFIYLLRSPGSGQVNFFNELNKAMMNINPSLQFNMMQRNNITYQQGAIDKNADMTSFYWTADYNDVGTWITYMISEFQIANLWPAIAAIYNQNTIPTNSPYYGPWIASLKAELQANFILDDHKNKIYMIDKNNKAITMKDIYRLVSVNRSLTVTSILSIIGNAISAWTNNTNNKAFKNSVGILPMNQNTEYFNNYQGGLSGNNNDLHTNLSQFLDYLNSFNANIPFVQDGPKSELTSLEKAGAHTPNNPEAYYNTRDWYYEDSVYKSNIFKDWPKSNPFENTTTPFNPSFTRLSNATYMSSIYSPLFSWSSRGDFYQNDALLQTSLVSVGANESVQTVENKIQALKDSVNENPHQDLVLEVPIRPLPWVNAQGGLTDVNNHKYYLSPEDYLAGFISYYNAIKTGLSHNDYFIELSSLNIKATIDDPANKVRNNNSNETKPFRIHFSNPIQLSSFNLVDILSMGYFTAIPAFEPKVQNIIDPIKFKKITGIDLNANEVKAIDPTQPYMQQLYGCGDHREAWKNLWTTSGYYVSNVNDQTYTFSINREYFKAFAELATIDENYLSFNYLTQFNGKTIKKFDKLEFKYAAQYNNQVAFEQFKNNEIQRSEIPLSDRNWVLNPDSGFAQDIYQPKVLKVPMSDLIPYNLQVLETRNGLPLIFDKDGNDISKDFNYSSLGTDKYGNLIFPPDCQPKIKSKISPGYYDLIVKNFYTPIDATDASGNLLPPLQRSSAIIRTAINDCINWFSLTSIVFPSETKVMQNSFMPYGVANMLLNAESQPNSARIQTKYWNMAAYKVGQEAYVKKLATWENFSLGKIRNTPGGIVEWTWLEYINQWKYKMEGKIA